MVTMLRIHNSPQVLFTFPDWMHFSIELRMSVDRLLWRKNMTKKILLLWLKALVFLLQILFKARLRIALSNYLVQLVAAVNLIALKVLQIDTKCELN